MRRSVRDLDGAAFGRCRWVQVHLRSTKYIRMEDELRHFPPVAHMPEGCQVSAGEARRFVSQRLTCFEKADTVPAEDNALCGCRVRDI